MRTHPITTGDGGSGSGAGGSLDNAAACARGDDGCVAASDIHCWFISCKNDSTTAGVGATAWKNPATPDLGPYFLFLYSATCCGGSSSVRALHHVSRSARRKAKQFSLSVDTSFDAVVAGLRLRGGIG